MNAPSEDIKDILVTAGIGVFGTDLFIGREPTQPNDCITIYDTGGGEPNPKWLQDEVTIQIRSRAEDYQTAYTNIYNARDKLLGRPAEVVNTTNYIGFWATTDIMAIEKDKKERSILVVNFRIVREPATGDFRQSL